MNKSLSRRDFLGASALTVLSTAGAVAAAQVGKQGQVESAPPMGHGQHDAMPETVGEVDHERNGFNPSDILADFDYGKVSKLETGQTLREYTINAFDKTIEVAPGIEYPAWTYNGRIPGPTIRCTEGDRVRIHFTNGGSHAHSMHFHGIHAAFHRPDAVLMPGPDLRADVVQDRYSVAFGNFRKSEVEAGVVDENDHIRLPRLQKGRKFPFGPHDRAEVTNHFQEAHKRKLRAMDHEIHPLAPHCVTADAIDLHTRDLPSQLPHDACTVKVS